MTSMQGPEQTGGTGNQAAEQRAYEEAQERAADTERVAGGFVLPTFECCFNMRPILVSYFPKAIA